MKHVTDKFPFYANDYYLSLIDWDDPDDPIRRIIIPHIQELEDWGRLDPSDEYSYTIVPGLEHKYNSTALLLVSDVCGGICRYCFRKRLFAQRHTKHKLNLPVSMAITNVMVVQANNQLFEQDKVVMIEGTVNERDGVHKLICDSIEEIIDQ